MEIKNYLLNTKKFRRCAGKVHDNEYISELYIQMAKDNDACFGEDFGNQGHFGDKFLKKAVAIKNCFKLFDINHFKQLKIKDIQRINLCHDKFCKNCQNLLSEKRFVRFYPEIQNYCNNYRYKAYHVVLTVPNVPGELLNFTLDKMYSSVPKLMTFFNKTKKKKVHNVDFYKYGYGGAVRNLEITTKLLEDGTYEYHPHFHCIFLLKKGINEERTYINDFSFKNGSDTVYKFTALEILIQKVWYLIYNNIEVTRKNIDELKQGYSCKCIKAKTEKTCKEVFKYTLKESFSNLVHNQEVFETLYHALYNRRVIQGYGILRGIKFENGVTDDEVDDFYYNLIVELWKQDAPDKIIMTMKDVLKDVEENKDTKWISKTSIRRALYTEKDKK